MPGALVMTVDVLAGAMGSVCIRGFLSLADRRALGYRGGSIPVTLFFNALFPLLLMLLGLGWFQELDASFLALLTHPGVMVNGLLTHYGAGLWYRGFRDLPVRVVLAVAKLSDLLLPAVVLALGQAISIQNALFSILSTLFFIPFLWHPQARNSFNLTRFAVLGLIGFPLVQVAVNHLTHMEVLAAGGFAFLKVFTAILCWRMVVVALTGSAKMVSEIRRSPEKQLRLIPMLGLRSLLSVLSQALYLFAVTRESGALAWPILNAGPLISAAFAHWLLNERMQRTEIVVLTLFAVSLILCLALQNYL